MPSQARCRQQAIGLADIGGVSEVYAMRIEHLRHQRIAVGIAHLCPSGIGFQINQAARAPMLLARLGRAAEIDDRVSLGQQLQAALPPHPQVLAAGHVEKCPAVAKPITLHHRREQL